jgi:hypothetical protein
MSNIVLWQPENGELLPATAKTPAEISEYAAQLSPRDKKQIVAAFDSGHFEMGVNYLWGRTLNALKKELSTVGVGLLGEMLGRPDVDEDDEVDDILTARDAIRLAEELGIVSATDAMRLRHTHELVTHFSQMDINESSLEEIDESEALSSLKACIKSVLGRPKVEVAKKFVDFREALEGDAINEGDQRVEMLRGSPYFFKKLTVSVLMNAAKKNVGANLEHTLANINVLIPSIWPDLRDTEKWQVGHAYAEAFADGKTTAVGGLKSALLKVRGFDFVPENLRSDTFVKAAEAILRAHDGMNNFYNEAAPVINLSKLGTTIPTRALPACITALLSIVLGNFYGVAWGAEAEASKLLGRLSIDRWSFYLNNAFPSDTRILSKLSEDKPRSNWMKLAARYKFAEIQIKNKTTGLLIKGTIEGDEGKVTRHARKLLEEYYGKNA